MSLLLIIFLIVFFILLFPIIIILGFLAALFFFILVFFLIIYWLSFLEIINFFDILLVFSTVLFVLFATYFIGFFLSALFGYFISHKNEKKYPGSCTPIKQNRNILEDAKKYSNIFNYILKKKIISYSDSTRKIFILFLPFIVPTIILIFMHVGQNEKLRYLQEYWT